MDFLLSTPGESTPVDREVGQSQYWSSISDVTHQVIKILDEKEHWVIEGHPDFQVTMDELLALIREHPKLISFVEAHPPEAFKLMAYLHTSTSMMMLHIDGERRPEMVERFIGVITNVLESDSQGQVAVAANLALDRFLAFERAGLLARIFSEERVDNVLAAIERAGEAAQRRNA